MDIEQETRRRASEQDAATLAEEGAADDLVTWTVTSPLALPGHLEVPLPDG